MKKTTELSNSNNGLRLGVVGGSAVFKWLIKNGFSKCYGHKDYDCCMRIHVLHILYWSENLNHFAIGVFNESGKKGAAGEFKQWHYTLIPKPIYTAREAKKLVSAIT